MSKKLALVLCVFFALPLIVGCGESLKFWKKKKEVEVVNKKLPPFEELFNRTIEMYNAKQYKDAINSLLFLRENYPQKAEYQSRITLYLADSHFHQKEYPEAIANYEEFIKLYPKSPDVPYAYFQIGMSNYKQRRSYDRDATFVRKALENFTKVLEIAPPGVLTNESIRMIAFCQRELAMHDFFIADFYLRTHHYTSALLRYNDILRSYPNLKIYDRAHLGIAKAYLALKEKDKAFRHLSFVAKHFPTSSYGKEAWKILQKKFKVVSLSDLPDVSFPRRVAKGKKEKEKAKPGVEKGAVAKIESGKKAANAEIAPKPHVYFPKISKVQEKPSVYFPVVKKPAEPSTPPKVRKAKRTELPLQVPKKASVYFPPVKTTVVAQKAPQPRKVPVRGAEQEEKVVKKTVETTQPKPVRQKPPIPGSPSVEKPGKVPVGEQAKTSETAQTPSKRSEEKATAIPRLETSSTGVPSPSSSGVKKMVKTDRLPPKRKEGAGTSSGLVGAMDTRQPIHITSDHVEAKKGKNSVRFYGNVVAKQKDVTLKCEDLTAFYTKGGEAIDKIIAHGKVSITQKNKKVICGKATFYNAERKIVLEETPTAWDGDNKISGGKMILLLEKNEIQVLRSRKKPTELVIYPDRKPASTGATK